MLFALLLILRNGQVHSYKQTPINIIDTVIYPLNEGGGGSYCMLFIWQISWLNWKSLLMLLPFLSTFKLTHIVFLSLLIILAP